MKYVSEGLVAAEDPIAFYLQIKEHEAKLQQDAAYLLKIPSLDAADCGCLPLLLLFAAATQYLTGGCTAVLLLTVFAPKSLVSNQAKSEAPFYRQGTETQRFRVNSERESHEISPGVRCIYLLR